MYRRPTGFVELGLVPVAPIPQATTGFAELGLVLVAPVQQAFVEQTPLK